MDAGLRGGSSRLIRTTVPSQIGQTLFIYLGDVLLVKNVIAHNSGHGCQLGAEQNDIADISPDILLNVEGKNHPYDHTGNQHGNGAGGGAEQAFGAECVFSAQRALKNEHSNAVFFPDIVVNS